MVQTTCAKRTTILQRIPRGKGLQLPSENDIRRPSFPSNSKSTASISQIASSPSRPPSKNPHTLCIPSPVWIPAQITYPKPLPLSHYPSISPNIEGVTSSLHSPVCSSNQSFKFHWYLKFCNLLQHPQPFSSTSSLHTSLPNE